MIIYNVTVKVDQAVHTRWLAWMKEHHIPRMMATGLFHDHRVSRLMEQDEAEGVTYVVQYMLDDPGRLRHYEEHHAASMQEDMAARFGPHFVLFRTVMEVIG